MNKDQFKDMVSRMPPLPHSVEGQPFSIDDSEALKWIMAQPGVKGWVWNKARGTSRLKFDPETRLWRGVRLPA